MSEPAVLPAAKAAPAAGRCNCARSSLTTATQPPASFTRRSRDSTTTTASRDFPTLGAANDLVGSFISHPSIWGVVAEREGRILGSNFLDERAPVRGVGPITVDPEAQAAGVGRRLMQAVIERGAHGAGIRLLQDSFNTQSLALYASLGFEVAEPVVVMSGMPRVTLSDHVEVRPLVHPDLEASEQSPRHGPSTAGRPGRSSTLRVLPA